MTPEERLQAARAQYAEVENAQREARKKANKTGSPLTARELSELWLFAADIEDAAIEVGQQAVMAAMTADDMPEMISLDGEHFVLKIHRDTISEVIASCLDDIEDEQYFKSAARNPKFVKGLAAIFALRKLVADNPKT